MTYLLLQTFLLLLASYFAGALTACLVKRAIGVRPALQPVPAMRGAARPQAAMPVPTPVLTPPTASNAAAAAAAAAANAASRRASTPSSVPVTTRAVAPRAVDPVQPKIDILARPEPKALPKLADTSRFDRALSGPDPNEGMPRRMIVEVRPAILPMVTGPAAPWPPPKKPEPVKPIEPKPVAPPPAAKVVQLPKPVTGSSAPQGSSAATAAAAAAAVAAAKAAAAAAAAVTPQLKTSSSAAADPVKPEPAKSLSSLGAILPHQAEPSPPPKASDVIDKPAAAVIPAPKPEPALATVTVSGDDFQRIRAIDSDTEKKLKAQGTRNFDDMGRWSAADVNRINQALGLDGRIDRDQWIEQAQILAKGGETYYSRNRAAALRSAGAGNVPKAAPADNEKDAPKAAPVQSTIATPSPAATPAPVMAPVVTAAAASPPVRSVADMAVAAAAAIAAASASVTRGIRPIEPISPLSKVDPKIVIPAKLSVAIKDKETKDAEARPPMADSPAKQASSRSDADDEREGDDLKRIRGIGVLIEKRLNGMGIRRYDQIANWTSGDIDRISQTLDFKGRIERENWVEHARILASGGHTEFSRRVDKGDVETSRDDD